MPEKVRRKRYALVGTGNRGTTMWGRELLAGWSDYVELVGICDLNLMRAERARAMMGSSAPLYDDFDRMMEEQRPELVIVCTPDDTHDDIIIRALEGGADVISEKPMTTTPEKIDRIRAAEAKSGRRVDVSFNYRFLPPPHASRRRSMRVQSAPSPRSIFTGISITSTARIISAAGTPSPNIPVACSCTRPRTISIF